jgi:hypothetical protein
MRLSVPLALLSACAVTMLTGCEPNQLYIASHTVVGVNAAVNPELSKGWVVVGYDRTFATVIPRSVPGQDEKTKVQKREAMSALACSNLAVNGITIKQFTESLATGEAARMFAENLGGNPAGEIKDFFSCFKDKKDKPSDPAISGGSGS